MGVFVLKTDKGRIQEIEKAERNKDIFKKGAIFAANLLTTLYQKILNSKSVRVIPCQTVQGLAPDPSRFSWKQFCRCPLGPIRVYSNFRANLQAVQEIYAFEICRPRPSTFGVILNQIIEGYAIKHGMPSTFRVINVNIVFLPQQNVEIL